MAMNSYGRELTHREIDNRFHRTFVGGLWEELGKLQLSFLIEQGLKCEDKVLDIGCGCLRGGIKLIDYLNVGNYYGIDCNSSLIKAGEIEVKNLDLCYKKPNLLQNNNFEFRKFNIKFDYMFSCSLFTHLTEYYITLCLGKARQCLTPKGSYYSTFFKAPYDGCKAKLYQYDYIYSYKDKDPYHYSIKEISYLAEFAKLQTYYIGDWQHPRNQKMIRFTL